MTNAIQIMSGILGNWLKRKKITTFKHLFLKLPFKFTRSSNFFDPRSVLSQSLDGSLRDVGKEFVHRRSQRHFGVPSQRPVDEHKRSVPDGRHTQHQSGARQTKTTKGNMRLYFAKRTCSDLKYVTPDSTKQPFKC